MSSSKTEAAAAAAAKAREEHIAALKTERAGYEQLGLSARVALVDEQIKHFESAPAGRAAAPSMTAAAPAAAPATPEAAAAAPAKKAPAKKAAQA